jgi:hypothetical protein
MADPRKTVSYQGIGKLPVSYQIDESTITYDVTRSGGSSQVGLAVKMSADDTIALVGDGDRVHGKLLGVEADGLATVQVKGYMTLPAGDGATVTVGKRIVGALGADSAEGYVREIADASSGSAAEINALAKAAGEIVNVSDATAVWVLL